MIYYFSGTGNSLLVGRELERLTADRLVPLTAPCPATGDAVGLVFPVYAWGLPSVVTEFVRSSLPQLLGGGKRYVYAVMTHGDDVGFADRVLGRLLRRHCGVRLDAAFSVVMPNTYVSLPGFDTDKPAVEAAKLAAMPARVQEIARHIARRDSVTSVTRGWFPVTKTHLLRHGFNRLLITDKPFAADPARCNGCGLCQRTCPVGNIAPGSGNHPAWQGGCVGCLGCYHCCPRHAIAWGKTTASKGQKQVFR